MAFRIDQDVGRVCSRCWRERPEAMFRPTPDGEPSTICIPCHEQVERISDDPDDAAFIVVCERQLRRASEEGRLHPDWARLLGLPTGTFRCRRCGMLHYTIDGANDCCTAAGWSVTEGTGRPQSSETTAVYNPYALHRAMNGLVEGMGITNLEAKTGISHTTLRKLQRGYPKFVYKATYTAVARFFPDGIPGVARPEG